MQMQFLLILCFAFFDHAPVHVVIDKPSRALHTSRIRIQNTIQNMSDKLARNINMLKIVSTLFSISTKKENVKLTLKDNIVSQVETPTSVGATLDYRLT